MRANFSVLPKNSPVHSKRADHAALARFIGGISVGVAVQIFQPVGLQQPVHAGRVRPAPGHAVNVDRSAIAM